jgi:hypothetical protein
MPNQPPTQGVVRHRRPSMLRKRLGSACAVCTAQRGVADQGPQFSKATIQVASRLGAMGGTLLLGGASMGLFWRAQNRREEREWRKRNGLPEDGVATSLDEIPIEVKQIFTDMLKDVENPESEGLLVPSKTSDRLVNH